MFQDLKRSFWILKRPPVMGTPSSPRGFVTDADPYAAEKFGEADIRILATKLA